MEFLCTGYVLPAAFALDIFLGDPRSLPHPVRWMGRAIAELEPFFRKIPLSPITSGALFAGGLVAGSWALSFLALGAAARIDPLLKFGLEIVLVYFCLAARSLEDAALDVGRCLLQNRLAEARQKVALIVGRDVAGYRAEGIARAAVETVAENLVDGVMAPLFFAALGGAPLAVAYKMVNTLDSMIGYKNESYFYFGKAAARLDDVLNYLPARLAVPVICLASRILGRHGGRCFKTALTEGSHHASPNAGYPEAAFAGALAVKLNGPNYYGGHLVQKPYIGVHFGAAEPTHIKKACDIMLLSALLWLALVCSGRVLPAILG